MCNFIWNIDDVTHPLCVLISSSSLVSWSSCVFKYVHVNGRLLPPLGALGPPGL